MSVPAFLFGVSPAGVIDVTGRDGESFLQGLCTNDVRGLGADAAVWAAALTPTGKVRFQFRASRRDSRIRLLLDGDRVAVAATHLRKYSVFREARIEEPSPRPLRFDFYDAVPTLPDSADRWPRFFEILETRLVAPEAAPALESELAAAGGALISEEEREARRIEAGRPRDGVDVDESRTPDEAGLGGAVSTTKGCYVGQEVVARMRTYGRLPRRLVAFHFSNGPLPAPGSRLITPGNAPKEAGKVTSAALSPRLGPIGLGYAARDVPDGDVLAFADDPSRFARVAPPGAPWERRPEARHAPRRQRPPERAAVSDDRGRSLRAHPASEIAVFGALLAAQFFLGVFPVIGKMALATIPPLPFALFRVAGASALLAVWAFLRPAEPVSAADRPRFWLLSFLGVSVNQIFFITGLSLSTAINAAILMTTIPVLTLVFAIMAGRESAGTRKIAGCTVALAGALVLVGAGRFDWRSDLFLGDILLMANAACYSLYLVLSRDLLKKYSAATFIRVTFLMGTAPVLVFAAIPVARMDFGRVTPVAWVCLAAVVVFASVLAYVLNAWALARTRFARGRFVTLQPVCHGVQSCGSRRCQTSDGVSAAPVFAVSRDLETSGPAPHITQNRQWNSFGRLSLDCPDSCSLEVPIEGAGWSSEKPRQSAGDTSARRCGGFGEDVPGSTGSCVREFESARRARAPFGTSRGTRRWPGSPRS